MLIVNIPASLVALVVLKTGVVSLFQIQVLQVKFYLERGARLVFLIGRNLLDKIEQRDIVVKLLTSWISGIIFSVFLKHWSALEIEELQFHKILACNHSTAFNFVKTPKRIGMVSTNKSSDIVASRCAAHPSSFSNFIWAAFIAPSVIFGMVFGFAAKTTIDVT